MSLAKEEAMMLIIPAARAAIAKLLVKEYNMGQAEIALKLSTTQAAISKYLNGHYSKRLKALEEEIDGYGISSDIAEQVAEGAPKHKISESLDRIAYQKSVVNRALVLLGKAKQAKSKTME